MGELGTVFERESLWGLYNGGQVFDPGEVGVREIDDMLRVDGKAKTLEQALTLSLRSATHSIEKPEGDTDQTELVREALERAANAGGMSTPLDLVLAQMASARLYRVAYFEKVFKVEDGKIVYDKLAYRPPASCRLKLDKHTGAFRGFKQRVWRDDGVEKVTIPPEKALVFIHGQHRRPAKGMSDLETVYAIFSVKQKIRYLWAEFLANQTMPKAVATTDGSEEPAGSSLSVSLSSRAAVWSVSTQARRSTPSSPRAREPPSTAPRWPTSTPRCPGACSPGSPI
jgi:hypothetical protein